MLSPLRDLFAAVCFLAIGLTVNPNDLLPLLPAALAPAAATTATRLVTGHYAASRDQVGRRGRFRAGTALIARGEFSLVIISLVGTMHGNLAPLVTAYVFILAITGPILTRLTGPLPASGAPTTVGRTRPRKNGRPS